MTKLRLTGVAVAMFFFVSISEAQIFSQGKNLNNQNTFSLNVELVKKPQGPEGFIAKVDFYGRRKDIDWFIKEGVVHKNFADKDELVAYLEDNGWVYLKTGRIKPRYGSTVREKYFFRRSMEQLSASYETEASIRGIVVSE